MGRIVIIGGVAAGASAAAKARRMSEDAEIVLVEAGPYMSFANCGLPYFVGGEIADRESLFVADPETFRRRFAVDLRLETRCTAIDRDARTVTLERGDGTEELGYDRLILATGTVPFVPPIEGIDGPAMFTCRTVPDVDQIMALVQRLLPREREGAQHFAVASTGLRALVIGGGYIGLEVAEQLMHRGFSVTVVELLDQLMGPLDPEMTWPIQAALQTAGAEVRLGEGVTAIHARGDRHVAELRSGRELVFDVGIVGAGVRPNVELAVASGLALGESGAIAVDAWQRTSDPLIFAGGDNSESIYHPLGTARNVPLAGPANKQGRAAGANAALDLADEPEEHPHRLQAGPAQGTGIVRVCGAVAGGTGLTTKMALRMGLDVAEAYVWGSSHAGYYPGAERMLVKLIYRPATGRLLGGQAVGGDGVDKRLDVLATAIYAGLAVEDLARLDLAYAPPFGSAKDLTVMGGFVASNARAGVSPAITPAQLIDAMAGDSPPLVVDVRTDREHAEGHVPGAINIPLEELRDRVAEVPSDRPVVVHCGVGYRSYVAQRILVGHGRSNVRNLLGGWSLFEMASEALSG
jgi:NADPH-dependent 2,4-dienoyl-CoA reductase/sulfur reductase-like enzyme/rhodanese-related sulfurtransferase